MFRNIARKPLIKTEDYLKYGFSPVVQKSYCCPRCGHSLNAGPEYAPRYCGQCGQHVTFKGMEGVMQRGKGHEPVADRMV